MPAEILRSHLLDDQFQDLAEKLSERLVLEFPPSRSAQYRFDSRSEAKYFRRGSQMVTSGIRETVGDPDICGLVRGS